MSRTQTMLPALTQATGEAVPADVDVLVVAVGTRDGKIDVSAPSLSGEAVRALADVAETVGHKGVPGGVCRVPAPSSVSATSVLLVGIGALAGDTTESAPTVAESLRRAAGTALRSLASVKKVALALPVTDLASAEAVASGALLGAYRYTAHLSDGDAASDRTIVIVAEGDVQSALDRAAILARAVAATRDMVNEPSSHLFPESFADAVSEHAERVAGGDAVVVDVVDDDELRRRGFGGLISVGSGSARGPRLVKITYAPSGADRHLALVGKGITFDSGGISLKPAANMEKMKSDMAGAAAAAQALFAIAELALPVQVTAWLALAENMPSGSAVRPSDVVRIYGGKTVEVINTDAEGRLVLADALVAAQEEKPDLLVDLATLTGAQVTALGYRTSGVMGVPSAREAVVRASETSGEPMWAMPIPEEVLAAFESNTADLKNIGKPAAGMLGAAAFLREFVDEDVAWAHLDIAGPAYNSESGYGYITPGGTGVPVRTLVEIARSMTVKGVCA
ncbi:leucyl aminopeptidase [Microbacterium halotolerans]|uniref:leucyl aminopeptidase n=1 Tax=Microbacterium halotolerans TaxID=246613 RepID=UPI000E6AAFC3|nr:leucyl aminopeptidase [Microbacterium halotolerans]